MIDVDVWADVRCPWCWIGLRRLRRASAAQDQRVRVHRRSFLLEPQGPMSPGRPTEAVATGEWGMSRQQWDAKLRLIQSEGSGEGLRIEMSTALMFDSNPLHRLLKFAAEVSPEQAEDRWDGAFAAHFERNEDLGQPAALTALASSWGLGGAETQRALDSQRFAADVAEDLNEARPRSVTSVPTLIAANDQRVSGSVSVEELSRFLDAAGTRR